MSISVKKGPLQFITRILFLLKKICFTTNKIYLFKIYNTTYMLNIYINILLIYRELALEKGCQMIYVECTSHFSAKAVERLGFQCIYSLAYTDYANEHGEIIFKTHSPHRFAKVYVLTL